LLDHQAAALEAVVGSEVACVEGSEVDLVAVAALGEATADAEVMEVEVATAVLLQVASAMLLLLPALHHQTPLQTTLRPEGSRVSSSTFAM